MLGGTAPQPHRLDVPVTVGADVVLAVAILLAIAASRTRRRRFQPRDIVLLDGRLHMIRSIEYRLSSPTEYGFEPLGEALARTIRIANRDMSLGQLLVEEGWRPPPEGGPR